jgi:hypothetical protein
MVRSRRRMSPCRSSRNGRASGQSMKVSVVLMESSRPGGPIAVWCSSLRSTELSTYPKGYILIVWTLMSVAGFMQPAMETYASSLLFFLNGKKIVLESPYLDPGLTLLDYLRSVGLTGADHVICCVIMNTCETSRPDGCVTGHSTIVVDSRSGCTQVTWSRVEELCMNSGEGQRATPACESARSQSHRSIRTGFKRRHVVCSVIVTCATVWID